MKHQMIPAQGWELDEYDQNMNRTCCYPVIGFLFNEERAEVAVVYVDDGEIQIDYPDGERLKLGPVQ